MGCQTARKSAAILLLNITVSWFSAVHHLIKTNAPETRILEEKMASLEEFP